MYSFDRLLFTCLAMLAIPASSIPAQQPVAATPVQTAVSSQQTLKLPVGGRCPVISPHDIPRVLVRDPSIASVVPRTPRELMVIARQPGQTTIYIWESESTVRRLDIVVYANTDQLQQLLQQRFPRIPVTLQTAGSRVVISGPVPDAATAGQIEKLARQVIPNVVNELAITAPPVVVLHIHVLEFTRADADQAGLLWPTFPYQQPVTVTTTHRFTTTEDEQGELIHIGIFDPQANFHQFVQMLCEKDCARIVAHPELTTMPGKTAHFRIDKAQPVSSSQMGSWRSLRDKPLGTTLDITPRLRPDGSIHLQVHSQLMEVELVSETNTQGNRSPTLRTRHNETTVAIRPGQTLALVGMPQQRSRSRTVGVPLMESIPYLGSAFQTTRTRSHEVEMMILVRPEIRSSRPGDIAGTR
jgi:pilus assembly protein CpaC